MVTRGIVVLLCVAGPVIASAATITVSTTAPAIAAYGQCSIIEAVENANAGAQVHADCAGGPGAATIHLPNDAEIQFTASHGVRKDALPAIIGDVTIEGHNARLRNRSGLNRLLRVEVGGRLRLNDVTLEDGRADSEGGAGVLNFGVAIIENSTIAGGESDAAGGGIANFGGSLVIQDGVLSNNRAIGPGGAIDNLDGHVEVRRMRVNSNRTGASGGGVANHAVASAASAVVDDTDFEFNHANGNGGSGLDNVAHPGRLAHVRVANSEFTNNSAQAVGVHSQGGAIRSVVADASQEAFAELIIERSNFSSNGATQGGAIFSGGDGASSGLRVSVSRTRFDSNFTLDEGHSQAGAGLYLANTDATIVNATFSGNTARRVETDPGSGFGGGVLATASPARQTTLRLLHTTFAGNRAAAGPSLAQFTGGGTVRTFIGHSIMAIGLSNFAAPQERNCLITGGTVMSLGRNLEDRNTCGLVSPTDRTSISPRLAAGAWFVPQSLSEVLLPDSPAIDAGDAATCAAVAGGVDRRGEPRATGASCDIGAYESDWPAFTHRLDTVVFDSVMARAITLYYLHPDGRLVTGYNEPGQWTYGPDGLVLPGVATLCDALVGQFTSSSTLLGECREEGGATFGWSGRLRPLQ